MCIAHILFDIRPRKQQRMSLTNRFVRKQNLGFDGPVQLSLAYCGTDFPKFGVGETRSFSATSDGRELQTLGTYLTSRQQRKDSP